MSTLTAALAFSHYRLLPLYALVSYHPHCRHPRAPPGTRVSLFTRHIAYSAGQASPANPCCAPYSYTLSCLKLTSLKPSIVSSVEAKVREVSDNTYCPGNNSSHFSSDVAVSGWKRLLSIPFKTMPCVLRNYRNRTSTYSDTSIMLTCCII